MDEVDNETQAAMAIRLADDVKKMIRDEVNKAFMDSTFVSQLHIGLFASVMVQGMKYNVDFKRAVRDVIIEHMQKS